MKKILISGLPRSGTTAAFYALEQAFPSEQRIAFLEPKTEIKLNLSQIEEDVADVEITKILVEERFYDGTLFKRADHAFQLVRDPRDIVVSWIPYRLVSRAAYTLNDRLREEFLEMLQRKVSDPEAVSVGDILNLYQRYKIPVLVPKDYGAMMRSFDVILSRFPDKVRKLRYEDLARGKTDVLSNEIGREVTVRRLEGEISVNQRAGSSGEWRQWFTPSDVTAFRSYFDPFLAAHDFQTSWDGLLETPIDFSALHTYVEGARIKRQALQDQTKEVERITGGAVRTLFGDLKPAEYYTAPAISRLVERAQHGTLEAMREYAMILENGIGVARDMDKARRYYRICNKLGDVASRRRLAELDAAAVPVTQ